VLSESPHVNPWSWRSEGQGNLGMPMIERTIVNAMDEIERLGRKIGAEFGAERVILFGSYACGTASPDSDIDLLVVAETLLPRQERYGAVRRIVADYPAAFDIVVETLEEYDRWRSVVNHIAYYADKYGRVLYERSDS
jgi:predicted nucleotidyltransferase